MFIRFLKSFKFSIILIITLITICIVATLIPQGNDPKFYMMKYGTTVGHWLIRLHLDRIFRSAFFLVPTVLFFFNLLFCTVSRLRSEIKRNKFSLGPDFIHVGVLLLIIAGMLTLFYRQEGFDDVREGGDLQIGKDITLTLDSFEFHQYPNGAPKDWVSHVTVRKGKKVIKKGSIEVNHPLRIGEYLVYQKTYDRVTRILMKDKEEKVYNLPAKKGFRNGDKFYVFTDVIEDQIDLTQKKKSAVEKKDEVKDENSLPVIKKERRELRKVLRAEFQEWETHNYIATHRPMEGEKIGDREVVEIFSHYRSGLEVVKDVGFFPMLASLILIILGLLMTYISKFREMEKE
jgi:cytochrome c biogenesis protein ResB